MNKNYFNVKSKPLSGRWQISYFHICDYKMTSTQFLSNTQSSSKVLLMVKMMQYKKANIHFPLISKKDQEQTLKLVSHSHPTRYFVRCKNRSRNAISVYLSISLCVTTFCEPNVLSKVQREMLNFKQIIFNSYYKNCTKSWILCGFFMFSWESYTIFLCAFPSFIPSVLPSPVSPKSVSLMAINVSPIKLRYSHQTQVSPTKVRLVPSYSGSLQSH